MKSFGGSPRWVARYGPPVLVFAAVLAGWEAYVRLRNVPAYILPSPSVVLETLAADQDILFPALLVTLKTTFAALVAAVAGGVGLAILFTQWKWVERSFLPFAIVLQVTPIVAIAPLLLIYLEAPAAVLVCAFLVAFFPILSNTALGLASVDRNL
ncbi:MAG: ABC transporter permease, partial [Methylocella sp.]